MRVDDTITKCELFLHWKIVFWGQRMHSRMEAITDNLTGTPRYKKHLQDLKNYLLKEVQLFDEEWHLLSDNRMVHPDYNNGIYCTHTLSHGSLSDLATN